MGVQDRLASFARRALVVSALAAIGVLAEASVARADDTSFRLPWAAGASQYLTQDANDDCCGDHVGANKYAFDFALPVGGAFEVVAPANGTIVHVKMSSNGGCGDASCVSDANYLVIDHGDGTQTTMLHLAQGSLDPSVTCGAFVRRGQRLATTGSTGWSTGVHLHIERDQIKRNVSKTCECGADGMACAPNQVEWSLFWPSSSQPNVAMAFDEWKAAPNGSDRRGLIGPSRNFDDGGDVAYVDVDRFTSSGGDWQPSNGGRKGTFQWAKATPTAGGSFSLKGAVPAPGTYEVWAYLPLSTMTTQLGTEVGFSVHGSASSDVDGSLDEQTIGGGFHLIKGLERVRLSGGETIVVSAKDPDDGRAMIVDGLVLHRVLDNETMSLKMLPPNAANSPQLGVALAAKGGGIVVKSAAPTPAPSHPGRMAIAGGAVALAAIALGRRRSRARR